MSYYLRYQYGLGFNEEESLIFPFLFESTLNTPLSYSITFTAQKMKFFIKDFVSKCDQICSFLRIWSHLLKKSLMENFIVCAVFYLKLQILSSNQKLEVALAFQKHQSTGQQKAVKKILYKTNFDWCHLNAHHEMLFYHWKSSGQNKRLEFLSIDPAPNWANLFLYFSESKYI